MDYLVLHIDCNFIAGIVRAGNGKSYPVIADSDKLIWLYFFNDPHQNRVTFGRGNEKHFNNREINYYGDFFKNITEEENRFTIRGLDRPLIELLEFSGILALFRKKYLEIAADTGKIPTLITFSSSIGDLAKQQFIKYLSGKDFDIKSYTIPFSELAFYYYWKQGRVDVHDKNTSIILEATNSTLHIRQFIFTNNYFLSTANSISYPGDGLDPRKKSILRFVINTVNKQTGLLNGIEEIDRECERFHSEADNWLSRLDAATRSIPIRVTVSLSPALKLKKNVLIRKNDVDDDSRHYLNAVQNKYNAFAEDHISDEANLASVLFFGNCFNSSLVRDRFKKLINNDKIIFANLDDIQNILSKYPEIDIDRYKNTEKRLKELAEAEMMKKQQERAHKAEQVRQEEERKKQEEATLRKEKDAKEAQACLDRARLLVREGKLREAVANIVNAAKLAPDRKDILDEYERLKDKEKEYEITIRQYTKLYDEAEALLKKENLEEALNKFELAKSIIDSAEIRNIIIDIKEKKRQKELDALRIAGILEKAHKAIKENNLTLAVDLTNEVLKSDPGNKQAKDIQNQISVLFEKEAIRLQAMIDEADNLLIASKFEEARKIYKEVLAKSPGHEYCIEQLKIIEEYTVNLEKRKQQYEYLLSSGDRLFSEQKWEKAMSKYQEAQDIFPEDEIILVEKIKDCKKELARVENEFSDLLMEIKRFEKDRKLEKALDCVSKALSIKPEHAELQKKKKKLEFDIEFANPGQKPANTNPKPVSNKPEKEKKTEPAASDPFISSKPKPATNTSDFITRKENKASSEKTSDTDFFINKKSKTETSPASVSSKKEEKKADDDFIIKKKVPKEEKKPNLSDDDFIKKKK